MIFRIRVGNENESWWEKYEKDITDPVKWAEETIEAFNSSLKPGEKKRMLLNVEVLDNKNRLHDWTKRTDGMSVPFRGVIVDLMFCSKCGITGKRLCLGNSVKRDSQYRSKKYEFCDWRKS